MKRVWRDAEAVAHPEGGYEIRLDGRQLALSDGLGLRVGGFRLADAIRGEWQRAGQAPGGAFGPDEIGLTRLAATMQHQIAPHRDAMIEELIAWGRDDLLRYREADPQAASAQAAAWDPLLDWLERRHGLRPGIQTGIAPLAAASGEAQRWRDVLAGQSDAALTALGSAVPALGSLILALALVEGRLGPAEAVALSRLDEHRQARRWGSDPAIEAKEASILREIEEVGCFLLLAEADARGDTQSQDGEE